MRRYKENRAAEASVDLTPMLDVVFILLIFFIVTSTFLQEEAIGMEPPPPGCDGCPKPETPAMIIFVDANDTIRMGGAVSDISTVRSGIERRRAETPDAAVLIQADPSARTGTVIQLRDIVYDAQIERVNVIRSAQQ